MNLPVAVLACALSASSPAVPDSVAFVGVHVATMEDEVVRRDQTVIVRGDRIAAVGPRASTPVPRGAQVVPGAGRYLTPGLYDLYAHVDQGALPLFVAHGVTTVRNTMPGLPRHLALRDAVRSGRLLGPRIFTTGPPLAGAAPWYSTVEPLTSAATARAVVSAQRAAGYDGVAVYTDVEPTVYLAIVEAARALGLPVSGHLPYKLPAEVFRAAGQRSKDNLLGEIDLRSGRTWVPEAELAAYARLTAQSGIWTIPTLTIHKARARQTPGRELAALPALRHIAPRQRQHWLGSEGRAYAVTGYEYTGAPSLVRHLHAAGARLLLGSDAGYPFIVPGASAHEELANLVEAGLSPYEALAAGTRRAAEFLGELESAGTITPGKRADLLLVAADPLERTEHLARIEGVMLRGRWLARAELDRLLEQQARSLQPVAQRWAGDAAWPPPAAGAAAEYEVLLRGTVVAAERLARLARPDGGLAFQSQSVVDPHVPTRTSFEVEFDAQARPSRAALRRTVDGSEQTVRVSAVPSGGLRIEADVEGLGHEAYERPAADGVLIAGPLLAVNLDVDVALNFQFLAERARDLEAGRARVIDAQRIELNFEEFGRNALVGEAAYVVQRLTPARLRVLSPGLNGSGATACEVDLAQDGLIESARCDAVELRRRRSTPATGVDHHVHLLGDDVLRDWRALGASFSRAPEAYRSAEPVLGRPDGDGARVARAVLVPMAHLYGSEEFQAGLRLPLDEERARVERENDHVAREAARYPGQAAALCSVPALRPYALAELERCRRVNGMAGVKLHLASSGVDLREGAQLEQVGRLAAWSERHSLPLLLHVDPQRRGTTVEHVERLAQALLGPHPRLTLVVAHLGGSGGYGPWTRSVFTTLTRWLDREAAAGRPRQVFFDLSAVLLEAPSEGVPATTAEEAAALAADLRAAGLERLVLGSDYPVFDPLRTAELLIERARLRPDEVEAIRARAVPGLFR
jgi:predicted TIM-barrel fold metal-dependent hydrolase/cytosine/adenosine deaminase-related metal-dependent hydrolase